MLRDDSNSGVVIKMRLISVLYDCCLPESDLSVAQRSGDHFADSQFGEGSVLNGHAVRSQRTSQTSETTQTQTTTLSNSEAQASAFSNTQGSRENRARDDWLGNAVTTFSVIWIRFPIFK